MGTRLQNEITGNPRKHKRRTPVKLRSRVRKAALEAIKADESLGDPKGNEYCRMLMADRYINSSRNVSVRELWQQPEFKHLKLPTVERWSTVDSWVERRRNLQEEIRGRVTRIIIDDMTQERVEHLRKLISLRESYDAVGMITDENGNVTELKLKPESLEAWLAGKLKLDQHIGKVQQQISYAVPQLVANSIVPTDRATNLPTSLRPRLSEEESLEVALLLRDKRMKDDDQAIEAWKAQSITTTIKYLPDPEIIPKKVKKKPPVE